MDDGALSTLELRFIQAYGLIIAIFLGGLIVAPDLFWGDFLGPYVWEPITKDAGTSGDAGYSLVNTAFYILTMIGAVIVFQALFRHWQLPTGDRMVWALIAWVALAPILRVLEDADFFGSETDFLFISPVIHIHLAAWLIAVGIVGHIFARDRLGMFAALVLGYLLFFGLLVQPNWAEHDMGVLFAMSGAIAGVFTLYLVIHNTWGWHGIPRAMIAFASALIVMGLGHWLQLASTPWVQENGTMPKENPALWPVLVVIIIPLVVAWTVWQYGRDNLIAIRSSGNEVGVIPDGMTLEEWESEDRSEHPVERLTPTAILATPMVAGMLFGQLCDGLATMVGIDWFGYSEKHPVSDAVIQFGDSLELIGNGAWLFFLVKAAIISLIIYLFAEMRVERRQQHLRVLIVLAVMIVGMAPGLRDIGRLILGV